MTLGYDKLAELGQHGWDPCMYNQLDWLSEDRNHPVKTVTSTPTQQYDLGLLPKHPYGLDGGI